MNRIMEAVGRVARRYAHTCWWADHHDLEQEAMRAALEARRTWDPRVGVPEGVYCARAASRALSSYLWRASSPVSASDGQLPALAGIHHLPLPEDFGRAVDVEGDLDRARWLREVREVLDPLLRDPDLLPGRMVVYDGERSSEVATRLGLSVGEVYQSSTQFRKAIWSNPRLWRLWQRKNQLDAASGE